MRKREKLILKIPQSEVPIPLPSLLHVYISYSHPSEGGTLSTIHSLGIEEEEEEEEGKCEIKGAPPPPLRPPPISRIPFLNSQTSLKKNFGEISPGVEFLKSDGRTRTDLLRQTIRAMNTKCSAESLCIFY